MVGENKTERGRGREGGEEHSRGGGVGKAKRISYLQRKIPKTKHKQISKQQNSTQAHQMLAHERWRTRISCLFPWCLGHTSKHGKSPSQPKRRPTGAQCGERSCTVLAETQMVEWCDAAGHCWSTGLDSASSRSCTQTLHILLHAGLFHAEGDLWVLVVEHDVCNTRSRIARGV